MANLTIYMANWWFTGSIWRFAGQKKKKWWI